MIDYHLHTLFCNHAEGTMEQYAEQAVSLGLSEICFLDHLTLAPEGAAHTMTEAEVPLYFYAVQELKERYRGTLDIKVGLEVDFNPSYTFQAERIIEMFAFDMIGGSVHFGGGYNLISRREAQRVAHLSPAHRYELYLEALDRMLDRDYFDVVCHLDVVRKLGGGVLNAFDPVFDRLLDKIAEKQTAVEVNTSGYAHPARELYPHPDLLEKCRQRGIPITLGSDAHSPESVGRDFPRAIAAIRAAGYDTLTTFTRRKPGSIAL